MWGGGTTHVVRLLQHPDNRDRRADADHQHRDRWVGHPARRGAADRGALPAPRRRGVVGLRVDRDRAHQLAPGWMLKAAPDCVGPLMPTMEARITADDGTVLPSGPRATSRPAAGCRCSDTGATTTRTRRPSGRPVDPHRRFRSPRRRDPVHRVAQARPHHPRRREHLPVRDRTPLDEHPDVIEAAVYGIDDPVHGQEVKAVVVVAPGTARSPTTRYGRSVRSRSRRTRCRRWWRSAPNHCRAPPTAR